MTNQINECNSNSDMTEPAFLYKYCKFNKDHIEYTERIFTHSEIYLCSPAEFNDPFDSKPIIICDLVEGQNLITLLEKYKKKAENKGLPWNEPEIQKKLQAMIARKDFSQLNEPLTLSHRKSIEGLGVFCMTKKRDDILMWSHYSDAHTGFCLEFDATTKFFARALNVIYEEHRQCINAFDSYTPQQLADKLLTKAKDWKYEKEWRIVDHINGQGTQKFPEEALTGVIMGCRISKDNKEKIINWCGDRKQRPNLYEAREKEKEFGLDIIEVEY